MLERTGAAAEVETIGDAGGEIPLYTMVKTNTFNGMPLPLIAVRRADGTDEVVRMFSYEDFKNRLS